MKIPNFNGSKNTWIAWNKHYVQDLNYKITSLFQYMYWQNPDYVVLNSPTIDDPYKSLQNDGKESRIDDENFLQENVKVWNGVEFEDRAFFYPYKLRYRQGFYNQAGMLGHLMFELEEEEISTEEDTNSTEEDVSTEEYTFYREKNNQTIYHAKVKSQVDNTDKINNDDSTDKADEVDKWYLDVTFKDGEITSNPSYNLFKTGAVCISNVQPNEGENDYNNAARNTLSNYTLSPIGSGSGNYLTQTLGNDLVFTYNKTTTENILSSFLSLSFFNRYINIEDWRSKNPSLTINNISKNKELQITTKEGNAWMGYEDLMYDLMWDDELIIADVQHHIDQITVSTFKAHTFTLTTATNWARDIKVNFY